MLPSGVKVVECNLPSNFIESALMNIPYISRIFYNRLFKDETFDCVITLKPGYLCAAYAPMFKKKIHWYHADTYLKYSGRPGLSMVEHIKRRILKAGLRKNDMVWTVSPSIAEKLQITFVLNNIHALPNPVNYSDIVEKSNHPCDIIFDKNCFNIVCIGRLSYEKGFDRMIRIFSDERLKRSHVHIYFIGDGDEKNALKTLAGQYQASDKITFLGIKPNPYTYLKQASLLVSPSRDESFGLTMLEAMTLGIPVISTATVGGMYVTQNGTLARMIDNSDVCDELAEQVLSIASSRANYGYSLQKAKEWASQHDVSIFGERFLGLLNDALSM